MFPEYREQMAHLRASDRNFARLCDKHAALDQLVEAMMARKSPALQPEIEALKKRKLSVKEEIYGLLRDVEPLMTLKQQHNYLTTPASTMAYRAL